MELKCQLSKDLRLMEGSREALEFRNLIKATREALIRINKIILLIVSIIKVTILKILHWYMITLANLLNKRMKKM
jgi:hypothetical protein